MACSAASRRAAALKAVATRARMIRSGQPAKRRKPIGVYILLSTGERWMFCKERTLNEAMLTARTLRGDKSLWSQYRVWLAPAL